MEWLNEPSSWQRTGDVISVSADPGTDFWRETGYGYIRDSGHVYGELLGGDLDVSVRVRGTFAAQYDQAGIMLRVDARLWLKTGMEFFEGHARLSTVLTLGKSSWMVTDLPEGTDEIRLRASRRGDAVEIRYMVGDGPAELAALLFLPAGREVLAGIMCAAPEGPGFRVTFSDLRIDDREWPEDGEDQAAPGWVAEAEPEDATEDQLGWAYQPAEDAGLAWQDDAPHGTEKGWAAGPAGDAGQEEPVEEPSFSAGAQEPDFAGAQEPDLGTGEYEPPFAVGAAAGSATLDTREPGEDDPDGGELDTVEPGWDDPSADEQESPGPRDAGPQPEEHAILDAHPGPSDPAADWDRLAAFARVRPWTPEPASDVGDSWPGPPLARAEPAQDWAVAAPRPQSADGADGHREELPESIADDETNPELPAAEPRGRWKSPRKKAPADFPAPVDPADEWISLLTADE